MSPQTIEGYTECSHGYRGPHCTREDEGSCPYPAHAEEECRCNESIWVEVVVPEQQREGGSESQPVEKGTPPTP